MGAGAQGVEPQRGRDAGRGRAEDVEVATGRVTAGVGDSERALGYGAPPGAHAEKAE